MSPVPVAQPVAQESQISAQLEGAWPLTLAEVRKAFPAAGGKFMGSLLRELTLQLRAGLADGELARAVEAAWNANRTKQKTAGLFLHTVPEHLAALKRTPKAKLGQLGQQAIERLLAVQRALAGQSARSLREFAVQIGELVAEFEVHGNLQLAEGRAHTLESDIIAAARLQMSEADAADIWKRTTETMDSFEPMPPLSRSQLADVFSGLEVLERLKIPRLRLFPA